MTSKSTRAVVDSAFEALRQVCQENAGALHWLEAAREAALFEERERRRQSRASRYRVSVETAARFHVLVSYVNPVVVRDALDAVSVVRSALYAAAIDVLLLETGKTPAVMAALRVTVEEIGPVERTARKRRGPSEWQREEAMQLGMGLGVEAYNDAMGWGD